MNRHSDEEWLKQPREKVGLVYLAPYKEWEVDIWGFSDRGIGDVWYNTLRMIILTDDKSDWAERALFNALSYMKEGKRWGDEFQADHKDHIAKNRIDWEFSKLLYKLKLRSTKKYRPQKGMTRDPWIMLYCCAIHLFGQIKGLPKPQWWLYRPTVWEWHKALLGRKNLYCLLRLYKPRKRPDFVHVLDEYMDRFYYESKIEQIKD